MLGIRADPNEYLNCSTAEMVFGSILIVHGEFVSPPQRQHDSLITKFVPKTTIFMVILSAHLSKPWILLLLSVRVDRHKTPLCRPYEGLFREIGKGVGHSP